LCVPPLSRQLPLVEDPPSGATAEQAASWALSQRVHAQFLSDWNVIIVAANVSSKITVRMGAVLSVSLQRRRPLTRLSCGAVYWAWRRRLDGVESTERGLPYGAGVDADV
jgi:hypothetical protein